ncbi:MAG: beta-lactamase family protein [Gammaproteobacteria bacterium]|nr:beta-lactamase family protein [Gammaproteobacteria bacterium]
MIKKMIIVSAILITALLVLFLGLRVPNLSIPDTASANEKTTILDKWFHRLHNSDKFNGVVTVLKQGELVFSGVYGLDGIDHPSELSLHSSFNLASVSKQFTAMAIVLLNQRSKLDYQDKLSLYIPELSYYNDITIQHLLHHTSGLPDYIKLALKHRSDEGVFSTPEMISLYKTHQPKLNYKPGTQFQYSNTGYVLLAEIIQRLSGQTFQQFMADNIFKPLNMNNTQVFNLLSEIEPDKRVYGFAYKYWIFGGSKQLKDLNYFDGVAGDGAVYSSAYDLNLWHEALRDGTLVSKENYQMAYTPAKLENGTNTKYGFGWFINDDKSVEHAGGWQGFTSYIYWNIDNDDVIIILDNSSNTLRVNAIGYRFNSIGINLKYFLRNYNKD